VDADLDLENAIRHSGVKSQPDGRLPVQRAVSRAGRLEVAAGQAFETRFGKSCSDNGGKVAGQIRESASWLQGRYHASDKIPKQDHKVPWVIKALILNDLVLRWAWTTVSE
jgi:hypothetical protein